MIVIGEIGFASHLSLELLLNFFAVSVSDLAS